MPKMKTKSAVKKRFSVTGTGKLKRNAAYKRHLLFNKPTKMKRQARGTVLLNEADVKIVKKFLPYLYLIEQSIARIRIAPRSFLMLFMVISFLIYFLIFIFGIC
ncbi:MAG: 50S ribosomal protein L35, partial [Alphaproteobacteria bacterium]|nr:50S ribosomal protein L35 [Alphaproteobacteria bacterium]